MDHDRPRCPVKINDPLYPEPVSQTQTIDVADHEIRVISIMVRGKSQFGPEPFQRFLRSAQQSNLSTFDIGLNKIEHFHVLHPAEFVDGRHFH